MGACFSTIKVSGSSSNSHQTAAAVVRHQRHTHRKESTTKPQPTTDTNKRRNTNNETRRNPQKPQQQLLKVKGKQTLKRQSGLIPFGKRTDFGYNKDFDERYSVGKLLGHGQFGYTYVATDKANGDRVAVKRIEKNK